MFRYRLTVRPFEGTLCAMPDVQLTPSQTKVYARAADEHSSSTDTLNFLGIHRKYNTESLQTVVCISHPDRVHAPHHTHVSSMRREALLRHAPTTHISRVPAVRPPLEMHAGIWGSARVPRILAPASELPLVTAVQRE